MAGERDLESGIFHPRSGGWGIFWAEHVNEMDQLTRPCGTQETWQSGVPSWMIKRDFTLWPLFPAQASILSTVCALGAPGPASQVLTPGVHEKGQVPWGMKWWWDWEAGLFHGLGLPS